MGDSKNADVPAIEDVDEERDADDFELLTDVDSDDSSDDEDETMELMRELERIKKEREEEAARKEAEEKARKEKEQQDMLLRGNPLLAGTSSAGSFASAILSLMICYCGSDSGPVNLAMIASAGPAPAVALYGTAAVRISHSGIKALSHITRLCRRSRRHRRIARLPRHSVARCHTAGCPAAAVPRWARLPGRVSGTREAPPGRKRLNQ
eukprot:751254-Hanusia_phi.AAC.2